MEGEWLYNIDLFFLFLGSITFILSATELGFRFGRRTQATASEPVRSEISTIQGALLGLLALILGFTFAMAMTRYEARKQLVLDESNAIGTTFLRAQILPQPPRQEISNLLKEYVGVRLAFYDAADDSRKLSRANEATERLQRELWTRAAALGEKDPRAVTTGLFLQSLNEVIDLHAKRITALENHVPEIILVLLYFVALMAMGLIGYGCGLGGKRNFWVTLVASTLIAAVILVIIDLDRPRRGLIRVSQQRMLDLQQSLGRY